MKKQLLNLVFLLFLSVQAIAQVGVRADLDKRIGITNEKLFGTNYFLEEDPAVGANIPRKNLEAQMQFKIVRYHTADMFSSTSPRSWLDFTNQKWNFAKIKQALSHRPANCDILINYPGWPSWMDTNNDERLDAGQETNYYNFCAILVDSVNNRWGYNVKYWEPFNEKDGGAYLGESDMLLLATYYKGARTAMRAKDNTIKCVAGSFRQPYTTDVELFLQNFTPSEMDIWSHHLYGGGCSTDTSYIYSTASTLGSGTNFARFKLDNAGLSSIPMWLDEWNMFFDFSCDLATVNNVQVRFQSNIVGGVFFGLAFKGLLENSKADAIMCWNFVDQIYGIATGTDPNGGTNFTNVTLRPSGLVLKQFKDKGIGEISPTTSTDDNKVQGFTVKRADGTYFFVLINRTGAAQSVAFNASGWNPTNTTVDVGKLGSSGSIVSSTITWSTLTNGNYSIPANSLVFLTTRSGGTVANYLPVTDGGGNRKVTLPYRVMSLQGNASDKDGTIKGYVWSKLSGPNVNVTALAKPAIYFTNLAQGTYRYKLESTDNNNAKDVNYANLQVYGALTGQEMSRTLLKTQFTGNGSQLGSSLYDISFDGKSAGTLENDQYKTVLTNMQQYQTPFRLTIKDKAALDLSANSVISFDIKSNVKIDFEPKLFDLDGNQVDVYATTIYVQGDNVYRTYTIDFAQYANRINYKKIAGLTLMQIDGSKTETRSGTVYIDNLVIGSSLATAPVSFADYDRMLSLTSDSAVFNGSGNDADGIISSFLWTKTAGPSITLVGASTNRLRLTNYGLNNTYTFNFKVTDNSGATGNKTCKLYTVNTGSSIPTTSITDRYLKARFSGNNISDSVLTATSAASSVLSIDQGQLKAILTNIPQYDIVYSGTIRKGASLNLSANSKFSVLIKSTANIDLRIKLYDLEGRVIDDYRKVLYVSGNNIATTYNLDFKDVLNTINGRAISRIDFMSLSGGGVNGVMLFDNINLGSVPAGASNREAVEDENDNQMVEVFPNPSGSSFSIHKIPTDEGRVTINFSGVNGINYETFIPTEGQTQMTFSVEKYAQGLHFINIQTEKRVQTKKVMILR